jgi:hypothetical protein
MLVVEPMKPPSARTTTDRREVAATCARRKDGAHTAQDQLMGRRRSPCAGVALCFANCPEVLLASALNAFYL